MPAAGYSGTPLAKKLGIASGCTVLAVHAPADYPALLAPLPQGVRFATRLSPQIDIVHAFVHETAVLQRLLTGATPAPRARGEAVSTAVMPPTPPR